MKQENVTRPLPAGWRVYRRQSWLAAQQLLVDERAAIDRHVRELDRSAEDLAPLDREIAQDAMDDPAVNRLMTITGVNLAVAAGIVAAIADISRFSSPQKLVSYFGLNPRVRQSGLGAAHHGRISKIGRSHARAMLVEAAWAAAKAPGPLHAFFVRIRARRGHQIAAVAVARKLTVLCWHLLKKGEDYLWARPALVGNKTRAMQLQAGHPQQKGNWRGPAYAYNIQSLRDCEMLIAAQAEQSYNGSCHNGNRGGQNPGRGRLSSAGQHRQSGDACSRCVTLRHEVARARQP
ncbi:transposase [Bradyrhizobium sp. 190]|uniref:transposase n=1 Tax=Bradyrhizobium sp. 190 TaxID=2782658 RepID=UPI001FFADE42|nr:transposase [Bradyrhizobium sp. 190]